MSEVPLSILLSNKVPDAIDEAALTELARRVLEGEGRTTGELSISFVPAGEMAELNARFAGDDHATDVLSFPQDEDGLIGDVVIAPEVARANNEDAGSEIRLLLVHGILHLLGHDHQQDSDRERMWEIQERYTGMVVP